MAIKWFTLIGKMLGKVPRTSPRRPAVRKPPVVRKGFRPAKIAGRKPPVVRKGFDPHAPVKPLEPKKVSLAAPRKGPVLRPPMGRAPRIRGKRAPISAKNLEPFAGFVHGQVIKTVAVTSSWVQQISLVMWGEQPALAITFHDGYTALYPTTTFRTFDRMADSASKGKFVWAALYYGKAYIEFTI